MPHWLTKPSTLAALALAVVASIAIPTALLWPRLNDGVVVEGQVIRSAQPSAEQLQFLVDHYGVRSVINLRGPWNREEWYKAETAKADELGLDHVDIVLKTSNIAPPKELRKLIDAFDNLPRPILIHCRRGSDRTALASALYRVLYTGASLDEAMSCYQLRYGHTGWDRGCRLPHLFDLYTAWLEEENLPHTPERLRDWLLETPSHAHFAAKIVVQEPPISRTVHQPDEIVVDITNTSDRPWSFSRHAERSVHVELRIGSENGERGWKRVTHLDHGTLDPGESISLRLTLPAVDRPGHYGVSVDLVDSRGFKFREMGPSGGNFAFNAYAKPIKTMIGSAPPTGSRDRQATNDKTQRRR
ncbi:hypothetical protein Pan216_49470 [Planctomycetes bacterium Pan216]|uniref:DSP-PTPase phosphatase fused to NAD+ Kinase domain-containing protein n=1 Tax=Kolteria novifilia TaxID=2527975 RepID=A0A518BAP6_9BACT|nr:hypothetical protein Pan216_49470 [Planctomycetes bacterium Pan216]